MRLLVICTDVPLPANTGGRVDVWRRLNALAEHGDRVALLCWHDAGRTPEPDAVTLAALGAVCEQLRVASISRNLGELLRRLVLLWRMPSHAASRWVTTRSGGLLAWARSFQPDAILLDGLYGGAVAVHLAAALKVPLLYRSHNIEHLYMQDQLARESRWQRRIGLFANCLGLARFEKRIHRKALRVFDISPDDRLFWVANGSARIDWLPTSVDPSFALRIAQGSSTGAPIDILYFGNLNTPNNIEALQWLVREVLPRVSARRTLRIVVAGSNPAVAVRMAVSGDARVHLVANPADMAPLIGAARVIVNPMQAGSGVNLKSVEMLFSNALLVSTSAGVKGLSPAAKAAFAVADSGAEFAAAVMAGLADAPTLSPMPCRAAARAPFAGAHMAAVIQASLGGGVDDSSN